MQRLARQARRFFWWCAAADGMMLDAPDAPRLDGIKYAAVGALVCLTTTVAACGWAHNAVTMLAGEAYALPAALGLGLLMGALVFCMERVLVVSIRQDASLLAKVAAFVWRGVIASLAAALVTLPFALTYFNGGILARLDDEKLALMAEKRRAAETVFGLKDKTVAIAAVDRDLQATRNQRDQLPSDVQALSAASTECEQEHEALQRTLQPKIRAVNARIAAILRDMAGEERGAVQRRLAPLRAQIGDMRNTLAAKARACRTVADAFAEARQRYYAELDRQAQEQQARRRQAQGRLEQAEHEAGAVLAQSDAVVARVTMPDLSARVRALGRMTAADPIVAIVVALTYALFFLIDVMPVLAKLVMRTVYDRRVSGEYRRAVAQIDAETALAEADTAIKAELAAAEHAWLAALLRRNDDETGLNLARLRARAEIDKAEIGVPFAQFHGLVDAYRRGQGAADDLAQRYAGRPDLFPHLEAVREALAKSMGRAAQSVEPGEGREPAQKAA